MAIATGTALLAAGVAGAGASVYSANKAAQAAKDAQRNLPNEIGGILNLVPQANATGLATRQQYDQGYGVLGNTTLREGLFGSDGMDSAYAGAIANGRATGYYGPEQTDEMIVQDFLNNGGRPSGTRLPSSGDGLVDSLGRLQSGQDRANANSSTFQRGSNLADMEALSPRLDALRRSANPEYFASLGAVDGAANAGIAASPYEQQFGAMALRGFDPGSIDERVGGPSALTERLSAGALDASTGPLALENSLFGQAQADLALGGDLAADEARQVRVQSRAAADARGRGFSNGALADEVLNTSMARNARQDSRRNFAAGVTGLLRSGQAADRGYGLNLDSANLARTQLRGSFQAQNIGNRMTQRQADLAALGAADGMARSRGTEQFGRLATAAGMRGQSLFDPASVLGTVDNRLNSTASLGIAQQQFQGAPDYLGQLLGYGSDVNGSNANARAAGGIASANAYSSLGGGLLSAAGQLGGAYMMQGAGSTRNGIPVANTPSTASGAGWFR